MICLFEPQCRGWQHELVNAGMVRLVHESFPNEKILLVADLEHMKCIKSLLAGQLDTADLDFVEWEVPKIIKQDLASGVHVYIFLDKVMKSYAEKIDTVLFLSSHRGNMRSAKWLSKKYKKTKFLIVVHAIMEEMLRTGNLKNNLNQITLRKQINSLSREKNVNFITYSPALSQELRGKMGRKAIQKMAFLHHPYPFSRGIEKKEHEMIRIGIIGACMNDNAINIINNVYKKIGDDRYSFVVIRSKRELNIYSNVEVVDNGEVLTRDRLVDIVSEFDYVLLPYDKSQYRVSASGVLFDVINWEIPVLMLDSLLLKYYNKYEIGLQFNSVNELSNEICRIVNENRKMNLADNVRKLKNMHQTENIKILSKIF